jgi:hypothetical protein
MPPSLHAGSADILGDVLGSGFGRCNDTLSQIQFVSEFGQILDLLAATILAVFMKLLRPTICV